MSVTGGNLRQILIHTDTHDIRNLEPSDIKAKYIPIGEEYRIDVIKEIIETRDNQLELPGFESYELEEILRDVCVS